MVLSNSGSPSLASAGVVFHGSRVTPDLVQAITAPVLFQQSDPAGDQNLNTTVYAQIERVGVVGTM